MSSWIECLSDEDLSFVRRFLLASGSLKQVAQQYSVSYPTIRLRLNRLIAKVQAVESAEQMGAFERQLRAQYADGKLAEDTFRILLEAYRREEQESQRDGFSESMGNDDGADAVVDGGG